MAGGKAALPPRWFIETAWHVHRLIVRASLGRKAYGLRAQVSGAPCSSPRKADAAASRGA
jgi:hypothetical protein